MSVIPVVLSNRAGLMLGLGGCSDGVFVLHHGSSALRNGLPVTTVPLATVYPYGAEPVHLYAASLEPTRGLGSTSSTWTVL